MAVALGTVAAGAGTVPAAQAMPQMSQMSQASQTSQVSRMPGPASWSLPSAKAVIKDTAGRNVGFLRVDHGLDDKSRLSISVTGLPAGYHGFHIHMKGVCDPRAIDPVTRSPFSSAGAHFTIHPATHSGHSGDLPNLLVAEDGTGEATVVTDRFRVEQLFDGDGSSVIVHALPDNHSNIPDRYSRPGGGTGPDAETLKAGDSGGRVACGVITRSQ
jgi:superoxide dismutase, Cu-Zn family